MNWNCVCSNEVLGADVTSLSLFLSLSVDQINAFNGGFFEGSFSSSSVSSDTGSFFVVVVVLFLSSFFPVVVVEK